MLFRKIRCQNKNVFPCSKKWGHLCRSSVDKWGELPRLLRHAPTASSSFRRSSLCAGFLPLFQLILCIIFKSRIHQWVTQQKRRLHGSLWFSCEAGLRLGLNRDATLNTPWDASQRCARTHQIRPALSTPFKSPLKTLQTFVFPHDQHSLHFHFYIFNPGSLAWFQACFFCCCCFLYRLAFHFH